ncbi:hypothetical protein IJH15_03025 [Candidatus Saccharibacteria bacterium]|nr:hypothetical protein [Candidatus Saccharibacteria bacterium]
MKKRLKTIGKIFIFILCLVALLGFINYEVYSIKKKEYERQSEIASTTHEQINLNLNMLKIAIQTNDIDGYSENLQSLHENATTIESLFMVKDEENDYLTSLHSYMELLENEADLLPEIASLKQDVLKIKKVFQDNYSDDDSITRDKLENASDEITKLKINEKNYSKKAILSVISEINNILEEIASKSDSLSDCIDNCYKNRINEINDNLADEIEEFVDKTEKLNKTIENQFDLNTLDFLKDY